MSGGSGDLRTPDAARPTRRAPGAPHRVQGHGTGGHATATSHLTSRGLCGRRPGLWGQGGLKQDGGDGDEVRAGVMRAGVKRRTPTATLHESGPSGVKGGARDSGRCGGDFRSAGGSGRPAPSAALLCPASAAAACGPSQQPAACTTPLTRVSKARGVCRQPPLSLRAPPRSPTAAAARSSSRITRLEAMAGWIFALRVQGLETNTEWGMGASAGPPLICWPPSRSAAGPSNRVSAPHSFARPEASSSQLENPQNVHNDDQSISNPS